MSSSLVAVAGEGVQKYDLRRALRFQVGDRVKLVNSKTFESIVHGPENTVLYRDSHMKSAIEEGEVLTVDDQGMVTSYRKSVSDAKQTWAGSGLSGLVSAQATRLIGEMFRKGNRFYPRTYSFCSDRMKKLNAPQVFMLKELFRDSTGFCGQDEVDRLLMPAVAVPEGHSWILNKEQLKVWTDSSDLPYDANLIAAKSAKFKLVSVRDGVAEVKGDIEVVGGQQRMKVDFSVHVSCSIELASGLWKTQKMSIDGKMKNAETGSVVSLKVSHIGVSEYMPGNGNTSRPLADCHKLGWQPPGEDTNNFKESNLGISLHIPDDFKRFEPRRGDSLTFATSAGSKLTVKINSVPAPLKVTELVADLRAKLNKTPSIKTISHDYLTLPNGICAALLEAELDRGPRKLVVLSLIAVDGKRIVIVNGGAPKEMAEEVRKMQATVRSLRVFEPRLEIVQEPANKVNVGRMQQ